MKEVNTLLIEIQLERYPLQGWNEAASYITGQRCSFQKVEEARAGIVAAM